LARRSWSERIDAAGAGMRGFGTVVLLPVMTKRKRKRMRWRKERK
jgi:hypothetical protein